MMPDLLCIRICTVLVEWQKINKRSSTKAELVSFDNGMLLASWTRNSLQDLSSGMEDTVVYQDNQSTVLLEQNERLQMVDIPDISRSNIL